MRKKALLIGAKAGVVGPAINFDGGTWEIESHPSVELIGSGGDVLDDDNGKSYIKSKNRVYAVVGVDYKGPPIHMDAVQINGK